MIRWCSNWTYMMLWINAGELVHFSAKLFRVFFPPHQGEVLEVFKSLLQLHGVEGKAQNQRHWSGQKVFLSTCIRLADDTGDGELKVKLNIKVRTKSLSSTPSRIIFYFGLAGYLLKAMTAKVEKWETSSNRIFFELQLQLIHSCAPHCQMKP